jgi:hypothetical protein
MFPSPHVPEHLARLRDALDSSPEESVTFGPSVFLGQEVFEPSGTRRKLGYGGTGCHHCNVKGIAQHPKSMTQSIIFILSICLRRMRKTKSASKISPIKPEIRTWYAFEGPLGDVIHNKRFFFAWKEGCLMGTYNTLEEATASLTSKNTRDTR